MKRDYSMSTAQIFTLFAVMLIQKGLFVSLLRCLSSERLGQDIPRLQGLPSWVPDLRSEVLVFHDAHNRDTGATLLSSAFIICDVCCMGSVECVEDDLNYACLQILHQAGHLDKYKLNSLNKNMRPARYEDLLCSLLFESSGGGDWLLVLRAQNSTHDSRNGYQLITCGIELGIQRDPNWPRTTICIA
jgi:hypothetical protein